MAGSSGKMLALLGSSAILGPMTAAERAKGRYMRAPDHNAADAEFAEFAAAGEVEGEGLAVPPGTEGEGDDAPKKPAAKRGPPKPAKPAAKAEGDDADAGDGDDGDEKPKKPAKGEGEDGDEGDDGDDGDDGDEEEGEAKPKPRQKTSDRIRELTKRAREAERRNIGLEARLEALEKGGLPAGKTGGNSADQLGDAPDPTDTEKYPLGHLDERYVEDRIEWRVQKAAADQADAVLQRQQEREQGQATEQQQQALLTKVDELTDRGSELYDDFPETVVDAGLKGEWDLQQPTFEAAHEAEFGHAILYELANDPKEATRVAGLTPYGQTKYVMERNAELAAAAKPRTKPKADAPPTTQARGANSRTQGNPATDDLDDFEKQWLRDQKGKK